MEMDTVITQLIELGAIGIMLVVCIWLLIKQQKAQKEEREEHANERKEWRVESNENTNRFASVIEGNTKVLTQIHNDFKFVKHEMNKN